MSSASDDDNALRWTAFATLVAAAAFAFTAGWMLPARAPDNPRDARSSSQERHAVLNSPAQGEFGAHR
jgi:hypothetical protein